jgi:hypothetical protein
MPAIEAPKNKKPSPPLTHNSVPSGGANKQGSSNDMGQPSSPSDWAWATFGQKLGGLLFRYPGSNLWSPPMKIHNASDKFVKVHGGAIAHWVAEAIKKGHNIIGIMLRGNLVLPDWTPMFEEKVKAVHFELTRNPKTYAIELTPADEESLLLIQEWEELNKDAYNDQAIY